MYSNMVVIAYGTSYGGKQTNGLSRARASVSKISQHLPRQRFSSRALNIFAQDYLLGNI